MEILKDNEIAKAVSNSTILITGATGMIGQNLVKLLLRYNDEFNAKIRVIGHARDMEKFKRLYSNEIHRKDLSSCICDVALLNISEKIDYIIHTASVTGGSKQHIDYPMRTIATSIDGARSALEVARKQKVKGIVFLSSLEVYGNTGQDEKYILEDDGGYIDSMNVRSSYSEGKRICECMFSAYAKQYGVPAIVARLTASFGYGVSYNDNRVFAQFAKSILNHKNIVLKSTGETVRDYCDTEDVARALLILLTKGVSGNAYNIANMKTEISIRSLAERFIKLYPESGSKLIFDLSEDAAKFGYNKTMRNVLDSHKIQDLGWSPQYDIDDMIVHLVESMQSSKEKESYYGKEI